jgi:hypothetical protein
MKKTHFARQVLVKKACGFCAKKGGFDIFFGDLQTSGQFLMYIYTSKF